MSSGASDGNFLDNPAFGPTDASPSLRLPLGANSSSAITAAGKLVLEYLWRHARAALRQIGLTENQSNGRWMLRWIKSEGLRQVSRESNRRDALAQNLNAEDTDALFEKLERGGWLQKIVVPRRTKPSVAVGGQPCLYVRPSGDKRLPRRSRCVPL
jgi:hypothetical protein